MPEFLVPGVYVEENPVTSHSIDGVSTATAGLIGLASQAWPPVELKSFSEFTRLVGEDRSLYLALAVKGFFDNGGQRCYVVRIAATDSLASALDALAVEKISILCCPDEPSIPNAAQLMAAHCEQRKDRVCILQSVQPSVPDESHQVPVHSAYAAYYYPWLRVTAPDGAAVTIPPCGHIAGVYARTDLERGVWKAPANAVVKGVDALSVDITDARSNLLGPRGINTLRRFADQGIRVWGARTTSEDSEWKYINVRRLLVFLEESIYQGLKWVVFEPNSDRLWAQVRRTVENFLMTQWRTGALMGNKPDQAYFVHCDRTTMTQTDLDEGRLVVIVGVAPVRPAEFVIVQITVAMKIPAP
jgi:hypothetical protein